LRVTLGLLGASQSCPYFAAMVGWYVLLSFACVFSIIGRAPAVGASERATVSSRALMRAGSQLLRARMQATTFAFTLGDAAVTEDLVSQP
jgi:hypothetical protein